MRRLELTEYIHLRLKNTAKCHISPSSSITPCPVSRISDYPPSPANTHLHCCHLSLYNIPLLVYFLSVFPFHCGSSSQHFLSDYYGSQISDSCLFTPNYSVVFSLKDCLPDLPLLTLVKTVVSQTSASESCYRVLFPLRSPSLHTKYINRFIHI